MYLAPTTVRVYGVHDASLLFMDFQFALLSSESHTSLLQFLQLDASGYVSVRSPYLFTSGPLWIIEIWYFDAGGGTDNEFSIVNCLAT